MALAHSEAHSQLVELVIYLSPQGRLHIQRGSESKDLLPNCVTAELAERLIPAIATSTARGILHLATVELGSELPPVLAFWREFGRIFMGKLCAVAELEYSRTNVQVAVPHAELLSLQHSAPPMQGGEFMSAELLSEYWAGLAQETETLLAAFKGSAAEFLHSLNHAWNLLGRVCFHLAENKANSDRPFAFIATYTSGFSPAVKPQHLPLARAIEEFAEASNSQGLLNLLKPVRNAAENSPFLHHLIQTGEIYHPLAWAPAEAYNFLRDIPVYEAAGIVVRIPDWWKSRRPLRPTVQITIGKKQPSGIGFDSLVDFDVGVALDGEVISDKEWRQIAQAASGLVSIKGRWVEMDQAKLQQVLQHWRAVEKRVERDGLDFSSAMRLLSGSASLEQGVEQSPLAVEEWSRVVAGEWLGETLDALRSPERSHKAHPGHLLKATLRHYQVVGVQWLWLLHQLRLGACLADDMGLGKTIQVLALMLLIKKRTPKARLLLVVPASLLGNWVSEVRRFAPSLQTFTLHPSTLEAKVDDKGLQKLCQLTDITITTYGQLNKYVWLKDFGWDLMVIDEAQAIKNPSSKQTAAAKSIQALHRVALTGTPVENRLSDLWSIFDFICPGLLGTPKTLARFVRAEISPQSNPYAALRELVRPYILRRLKTDRTVIADLPEKTEVYAYCGLTREQAVLYEKSVVELKNRLAKVAGMQRRGVILSYLMRFKQICNHPSQWLGTGGYNPEKSGKFGRLAEIVEQIAERQEKVLVFTQFKEMTEPLAAYLATLFGRKGLVLHGATPVAERQSMVNKFQSEDGPPFFILSLKAGGTGLNLTSASHVIHFDRWWNPAIESQATDRAFRIGQRRNVLVHKFVCKGTIEEKIDAMIEGKKAMAADILEDAGAAILTELSNEDLLHMVSLDINSAYEGIK